MGELAEKYHQEKEKNRQLLSELKRMNDTLSRFESRISVLGREKKTLESEIDKMKEKQALTQKLEAHDLSEHGFLSRSPLIQQQPAKTQIVRDLYYNEAKIVKKEDYDSRSQYSNFVKDMLSSSHEEEPDDKGKFRMQKIEMQHLKHNTATVEPQTDKQPEVPQQKPRRSTDLIGNTSNGNSRQQNFRGRQP